MTTATQNRPSTAEGTEATGVLDANQSTADSSAKHYPCVPPINQLISDEVELFFHSDQTKYTSEDVEAKLIFNINTRILAEMKGSGLKGALAYRTIKVLPSFVIATCILKRDMPHAGLLGESRESAALVAYVTEGPDEGLYARADHRVWTAVKSYNASATEKDFNEVLLEIRGRVPFLAPTEEENVVALANGLFDLETKELREFTPEVVFTSKAGVRWNPDATTSPVIDGWTVDRWLKSLAVTEPTCDDMEVDVFADPEVEQLLWEVVAALFRPNHSFDKAVLLVSDKGSNGKGTFLALLRNLVGAKRAVSLSMSEFGRDFLPEKLAHAFCVLSDESDVGSFMHAASTFKAWVTHDWISLNRKGRDFIDVKGRGLCVFCLNDLPKGKDKTESLYRRFIAVPFRGVFRGVGNNRRIKSDYIHREDVLEYVAHRALMMPLFDSFSVPQEARRLVEEIRVNNSPIEQFAERFLPEFKWDLVPWDFAYALYRAWMKADVPMGKPINKNDFTKDLRVYVDEHVECGWMVTRNPVRTNNKILGDERLAVDYDLSNWFDMRTVNGSMCKIGLPHNMPVTARGLLRASVASGDDDEPVQAPVVPVDDPVSITPEEVQDMSARAAEAFKATLPPF